ncbi:MAG: MBL fold metallo-hydrolase [Tannerellaceae bacterium]|nr:MBL fold metallo-hydrolase [Tannerellaceae bacterium]
MKPGTHAPYASGDMEMSCRVSYPPFKFFYRMKVSRLLTVFLACISMVSVAQHSDVFVYQIGDRKVTLLSENQGEGNPGILIGATPEMLREYTQDGKFPNAVNAFLVQGDGKNILIDTGFGRKLFDNLVASGVTPEQVDVILITHMHGDHIGGLMKEGEVAFPNATLYLPEPEHAYWTDEAVMNAFPEDRRGSFQQAQAVARAYDDRLKLFAPQEIGAESPEILPGIVGIAAYGHTPGHSMFLLTSGTEKLLIWGDLTHAMAIQMPYPQVAVTYDVDPDTAVETREAVLKYVSAEAIPVAGMHVAYPGIGRVVTGTGAARYQFIPEN